MHACTLHTHVDRYDLEVEPGTTRSIEVITTAAVGANLTSDPEGDELGLSGMAGVTVDGAVSGLRIVDVTCESVAHRFETFGSGAERVQADPSKAG